MKISGPKRPKFIERFSQMAQIPSSRPQASRFEVAELLRKKGIDCSTEVVLVGVRGYFANSMGAKGKNDRLMYDDAMFIIGPNVFRSFNCNVDPGAFRKGIANLVANVYRYKLGIHGLSKPKFLQYKALVQAAKVTVKRDQSITETGFFGINIHRGGSMSVSSIGCQTIPPSQWGEFIDLVTRSLASLAQKEVVYCLHEAGSEGGLT